MFFRSRMTFSLVNIPIGESYELTCFEDVYTSTRQGVWMQQFEILIQFRKDAARIYGEPAEALSHPESADEMVTANILYSMLIISYT